jgi:quercetin dioxygenase-like cupin family protein
MTLRHAPLLLVLLTAVGACAPRPPHAVVGLLDDGVAAFAAEHPLAAGQAMRVDEVARTPAASYHVVQARGAESPHRHLVHDLTVHVLSGGGVLVLARRRVPLRAGDVVLIARGVTHWFTPGGREPAVALAVFTPPLDGPDAVPVDVDSAGDGR